MGRKLFIEDDDNYKPKHQPKLRRWTKSAIDCYNRGCVCKGCEYQKILSCHCRMKLTVLELVRLLGKPENIKHTAEDITKKQLEYLYVEKRLRQTDIFRILHIDRFELLELLEKYEIPLRKKPRKCENDEV